MMSAIEDWMRRMVQDDYNNPMMYYQLEQLYPSSYYQLEVRAMNDIGWSDPNPLFVFSTAAGRQLYCQTVALLHVKDIRKGGRVGPMRTDMDE
jgi:hypothetical protein